MTGNIILIKYKWDIFILIRPKYIKCNIFIKPKYIKCNIPIKHKYISIYILN